MRRGAKGEPHLGRVLEWSKCDFGDCLPLAEGTLKGLRASLTLPSPVARFTGLPHRWEAAPLPKVLADLGPLGKFAPFGVSARIMPPLELVSTAPAACHLPHSLNAECTWF